jgi:hypothetical protein
MVVGSPVALGAWEYEDGFALTWSEGDIWVGTVDVAAPSTEAAEFKFVVVPPPPQTQPKWEGGENRVLSAEPNVRALKVSGALEGDIVVELASPTTPFVGETGGGEEAAKKWAEESAAALAGATAAAARPTDSEPPATVPESASAVAESTPEGLEPTEVVPEPEPEVTEPAPEETKSVDAASPQPQKSGNSNNVVSGGKKSPEKTKAKRPPSAYLLYCAEARGALPEGMKVPEQAKMLGAQWKALGEEEKARFQAQAAEAKEAAAAAAPAAKTKAKRPPSAYLLYCAEARGALPEGMKVPEQAKMLGAQWKALGEEEKARFQAQAAEAKEAAAGAAA